MNGHTPGKINLSALLQGTAKYSLKGKMKQILLIIRICLQTTLGMIVSISISISNLSVPIDIPFQREENFQFFKVKNRLKHTVTSIVSSLDVFGCLFFLIKVVSFTNCAADVDTLWF